MSSYSSSARSGRGSGDAAFPSTSRLLSEVNEQPWYSMVLPPKALPFIALFLILFPLVMLVAESFISPLYSLLLTLFMPFSHQMGTPEMPVILLLKVAVFALFAVTTLGLLLIRILGIYHQAWASQSPQVHPLHVPFHPDPKLALVSVANWIVYRNIRVLAWPLGLFVCTLVATILCLMLMQFLSEGIIILAQLLIIFILFLMLLSGYFMVIRVVKSVIDYFTTSFGLTASILEPEQPAEVIYDRVKRLAFHSPWAILAYAQQLLSMIVFVVAVLGIFEASSIDQALGFGTQWPVVILFSIVTLSMILVRYGIQYFAYVDSLKRFYQSHT